MTDNLQELVLGWVIQTKNTDALQYLKKSHFNDPTHKEIITIIQDYYKSYGKIPSFKLLLEYTVTDRDDLKEAVAALTIPKDEEKAIQDLFNGFIKKQEFKSVLNKYLPEYQKGRDVYSSLYTDIEKIININIGGSDLQGIFLEKSNIDVEKIYGNPTFLQSLNDMTSAGGFYAPQLIVFLGGPKTFKTGLLINLAVEYAYAGKKVFYADFENGLREMRTRLQQCVCHCTEDELVLPKWRKFYKKNKQLINDIGGGVYLRSFFGRIDSIKSIEKDIDTLIKVEKWVPDILIIDYLDIVGASDHNLRERRLIIQDNYIRTVALNQKYDCFTFSISKVKQTAYNKDRYTIEDFGEDAEKAYNAHAAFAFVRDQDDFQAHRARISALVQRRGESYGKDDCWLEIDESRHRIEEIDPGVF